MTTIRLASIAGVMLAAACASNAPRSPLPVTTGPRFATPDQILVAPESGSVTIKLRQPGHFDHPPTTVGRGAEVWTVVAFVIDTTGRVERRTVSFLPPAASPELRHAICSMAFTQRYAPPLANGQARRVLIVQSFTFGPGMNTGAQQVAYVKSISDELRRTSPPEALARLEPLPHCDDDE